MQSMRGIAARVVLQTETHRDEAGGEHLTYTVSFLLDGRKVSFASPSRPAVDNDDDVAVCGKWKNDTFQACAYDNFTARANGKTDQGAHWLLGAILLLGLAMARNVEFGPIFGLAAAYFFYRAVRFAAARRRLRSLAPGEYASSI